MRRAVLLAIVAAASGCWFFNDMTRKDTLVSASRSGNLRSLKQLLRDGAAINGVDKYGGSAMTAAVGRERTPVVEFLLERGASPDHLAGGYRIPICLAVRIKHRDRATRIVDQLIKARAKLDVVCKQDGETPLTIVARKGNLALTRQLLEAKASINFPNKAGKSPLAAAASEREAATMRTLIASGADPKLLSWSELMPAIGDGKFLYQRFTARLPVDRHATAAELQAIATDMRRYVSEMSAKLRGSPIYPTTAILRAGLSPNAVDSKGVTSLEAAWRDHQPVAVAVLLASGATGARRELGKIAADLRKADASREEFEKFMLRDPVLGKVLHPDPTDCYDPDDDDAEDYDDLELCDDRGRSSRQVALELLSPSPGPSELEKAAMFFRLSRALCARILSDSLRNPTTTSPGP